MATDNVMMEGDEETSRKDRAQPNKDPSTKKANWVDSMLDLYSSGRGDAEVRKELGITRDQFDQYCQDVPAFAALVQRGREYSEAWWWAAGRENIKNRDFVTAIWQTNMAQRFGWHAKKESQTEATLNVDKLREELRRVLPDMANMLNVVPQDVGRMAVVKSLERK
jgi:hypothetical protein